MEVFAAFTDETDYEMGRLLEVVRSLPDADNTLIFYEVGDNGSSAEGGLVGLLNENSFFNNVPESLEDNLKHIDELGGPKHFNHFPAGWAWAMNTPFQWTKQIASHLGGVRNPLAVSWPARIKDKGGVRAQFHHVIDIAPTIYEAVRHSVPGDAQRRRAEADRRRVDGLLVRRGRRAGPAPHAVLRDVHQPRPLPRRLVGGVAREHSVGRRARKPAESRHGDVGAVQPRRGLQRRRTTWPRRIPQKLRELQDMWWTEAARVQRAAARRPQDRAAQRRAAGPAVAGRQAHVVHLLPRRRRACRRAARRTCSTSRSRSRPTSRSKAARPSGAIFSLGGSDGGYGLYVRDGKPVFAGNFLGRTIDPRHVDDAAARRARSSCAAEFKYDGGGMGKGGTMTLFVNGKKVGEARIEQTQGITLGLGGTLDIGEDTGSAVDDAYTPPFRFNGTIKQVTVDLKPKYRRARAVSATSRRAAAPLAASPLPSARRSPATAPRPGLSPGSRSLGRIAVPFPPIEPAHQLLHAEAQVGHVKRPFGRPVAADAVAIGDDERRRVHRGGRRRIHRAMRNVEAPGMCSAS